jgi:uncharacterized protein
MKFCLRMAMVCVALVYIGSPAVHVCRVGWKNNLLGITEASADSGKVTSVMWEDLQLLNVRTGQMPARLKHLDGTIVRIPGYIIPLEDSEQSVSEFLLVPYPLACIHVPAPPPNMIVHVKMDKGKKVPFDFFEPVWTQGELKIQRTKNIYTESSYFMTGLIVEPYEYKK